MKYVILLFLLYSNAHSSEVGAKNIFSFKGLETSIKGDPIVELDLNSDEINKAFGLSLNSNNQLLFTNSKHISTTCKITDIELSKNLINVSVSDSNWLKQKSSFCRKKRKKNPKKCIPTKVKDILKLKKVDITTDNESVSIDSFSFTMENNCEKEARRILNKKYLKNDCYKSDDTIKCLKKAKQLTLKEDNDTWIVSGQTINLSTLKVESTKIYDKSESLYTVKKIELINENNKAEFTLSDNQYKFKGYYSSLIFDDLDSLKLKVRYNTKTKASEKDFSFINLDPSFFPIEIQREDETKYITKKIIEVDETPTFFFRATNDASLIGYSTFINNLGLGNKNTNNILDVESKRVFKAPGYYDPVALKDDRLMSVPMIRFQGQQGLAFYKTSEIFNKELNAEPLLIDASMRGYYQSIGLLESGPERNVFRVIIELGTLQYRDYEEVHFNGETQSFNPIGPKKTLCNDSDLKLPMVSKNGTMVTGYNVKTNKTNIVSITGEKCLLIRELPFLTGKASFSYDDKYITYHKYMNAKQEYYKDPKHGFLDLPPEKEIANIYIMNIQTGEERRITTNFDRNSIFPDFLENGDIIFVNHPFDTNLKKTFEIYTPDFE